jgi:GTP-binding protein YchF
LGNKFLSNIRETDAVLYVLRAFKNPDIINTQQDIDPLRDKEILDVELILKDLETINKRLDGLIRANMTIQEKKECETFKKAQKFLSQEKVLCDIEFSTEEKEILQGLSLLTAKPRLFLLNGNEEDVSEEIKNVLKNYVIVDVQSEHDAEDLSKEDRVALGLPELSETDILVKKAYELLGLITFLTTGEDETRAWTINRGDTAPKAGAAIHTDFENKFVKAEVVYWKDLVEAGSYAKARENAKIRTEGKEYVVKDGDVIEFKHG